MKSDINSEEKASLLAAFTAMQTSADKPAIKRKFDQRLHAANLISITELCDDNDKLAEYCSREHLDNLWQYHTARLTTFAAQLEGYKDFTADMVTLPQEQPTFYSMQGALSYLAARICQTYMPATPETSRIHLSLAIDNFNIHALILHVRQQLNSGPTSDKSKPISGSEADKLIDTHKRLTLRIRPFVNSYGPIAYLLMAYNYNALREKLPTGSKYKVTLLKSIQSCYDQAHTALKSGAYDDAICMATFGKGLNSLLPYGCSDLEKAYKQFTLYTSPPTTSVAPAAPAPATPAPATTPEPSDDETNTTTTATPK